jgi:S-DNA-T family DNA segregation ATPase FtsK/SpoIIIE
MPGLPSLRWPTIRLSELEQSERDAVGLALVGVSVFFSFVFYFGWDGGQVGRVLSDLLVAIAGRVAYVAPLALLAAGGALVLDSLVPLPPRARAGGVIVLLALTLGYASGAFGLGPDHPARHGFFDYHFMTGHGGVVGELLYLVTSTLFQRIGAQVIFVLMLMTGVLLLTGGSVAGLIEALRNMISGGVERARARAGDLGDALGHERELARADALPAAPAYEEPDGEPAIIALHDPDGLAPSPDDAEEDELEDEEDEEFEGETEDFEEIEEEVEPAPALRAAELTPQGARRSSVTESEELRYRLPDPRFLKRSGGGAGPDTSDQEKVARTLVETLGHFGIEAAVVGRVTGPRVTRHEISLAPGTKVAKVTQLKDDLAYALASTDIRILAPIPGKQAVGVEVPNQRHRMVCLGDIFRRDLGTPTKGGATPSPLAVWLGKDIAGNAVWTDLARMPHVLVAGTTGSGKSGCINAMLSSVLLRSTPNEVRMVLVDPKRVELNHYEEIPHLLTPVVTVPRMAANVLANLIGEMENRYEVMGQARSRNIVELNRAREGAGEPPLPYILCVIDELADLMMVAPGEVEDSIIRLAQKSRAVGIHLVLATQRPSVDVITGTIKVNVPARISFAVSSQHDSRVILDQVGSEALLGQGDMLFRPVGSSKLQRVQGAYITEDEIARLVEAWRTQGEPSYERQLLDRPAADEDSEDELSPDEDDLLREAVALVVQTQTASVSMLQRRLRVGYTRAGRLIDMLERRGVISGYEGSKPRQVLVAEADIGRVLAETSESHGDPVATGAREDPFADQVDDD